jgi:ribosomal protein L37E
MTLKELLDKGGHGYLLDNQKLALIRCPECHMENYAMNVLSGICTWCGFDVNENK